MLLPFLRNKTESRMCVLGYWGAGGGRYKSKSIKSNLVEYVQFLALDGRPTWNSFVGRDTKSSKQRL